MWYYTLFIWKKFDNICVCCHLKCFNYIEIMHQVKVKGISWIGLGAINPFPVQICVPKWCDECDI